VALDPTPAPTAAGRPRLQFRGRAAAIDHALIVVSILLTAWLAARYVAAGQFAVDFGHDFWLTGVRVRHGISPYTPWTRDELGSGFGFPYPAPGALLFVPFSVLGLGAAKVTFDALSIAAGVGGLRLAGVRDWRPYALALVSWPVINSWQTGNVTLLLVLGVAAAWRLRDRPLAAGLVIALTISLKPITWPLAVWLLATRRVRATAWMLVSGLIVNALAWAIIGFDQIGPWLHLVSTQEGLLYHGGYSLTAFGVRLGLTRGAATAGQMAIAAAVLFACTSVAWRRGERPGFVLAVVLMLVASPWVDNHYFALLLVPIAVMRPTLDRVWVVMLGFWLCPAENFATWHLVLAWVLVASITSRLLTDLSVHRSARPDHQCRRALRTAYTHDV
jgi:hypothetical protein